MKTGIKGIIAIASALFIAGVAHQASAGFSNFMPKGQWSTCTDTTGDGTQIIGHACIGNDPFCDVGSHQVAAFCNGNDCLGEEVHGVGCPTGQFDSRCAVAISRGPTASSQPAGTLNFSACAFFVNFEP